MISEVMETALNKQINLEAYASFLYLSMASWCDRMGLEGCTKFMHRQSQEEYMHMMKIFGYLSEVDAKAIVPSISQPPSEFDSVQSLFAQVYEHEQRVTRSINDLVALSHEQKDHSTGLFLQWYVEEQREEEALMRSILDKIRLIGDGPQSLYFIDLEIEKINTAVDKASAAEEA